jgi:hypothetical protein
MPDMFSAVLDSAGWREHYRSLRFAINIKFVLS